MKHTLRKTVNLQMNKQTKNLKTRKRLSRADGDSFCGLPFDTTEYNQ